MDNAPVIRFDKGSAGTGFKGIIKHVNAIPALRGGAAVRAHRNGAALTLWEMFQQVLARDDARVEKELKQSRVNHELGLRVRAMEKILKEYGEILHKDDRKITFYCISCSSTFELHESEAAALDFAALCPSCHGWALPGVPAPPADSIPVDPSAVKTHSGRTRTTKEVAQELNCSTAWVVSKARELGGLGRSWGGGGTGNMLYFKEAEFDRLRELLKAKSLSFPRPPAAGLR